jgi:hypothetical protein
MTMYAWGVINAIARLEGQFEQIGGAIEYTATENRDQVRALFASLREVAVTLGVTLEVLAKAGLVDPEAIHRRVAEELAPKRPDVTCITCGRVVPADRASITAIGTVCQTCSSP